MLPSSGMSHRLVSTFIFDLPSGTDVNFRTACLAAGWNGNDHVEATIQAGTVIQASTNAVNALTINGVFPNRIKITNKGVITGKGGTGGSGYIGFSSTPGAGYAGTAATAGGPALSVSIPCKIDNTLGTINGGGGGGGGGGQGTWAGNVAGGGGGGGGGAGFGVGGSAGSSTAPATASAFGMPVVGAISNGVDGTSTGSGSGGTPALFGPGGDGRTAKGGTGGAGGAPGAAGGSGGGSQGASTGTGGAGGGAAGGACLSGNAFITWGDSGTAFGTRNGAIT